MKTIRLGLAAAVLAACGGSDNTVIPDSGADGAPSDATTNDTGTNDIGTSDTGNDSGPVTDGGGNDGDAAAFNPGTVLGLVLWLEGDVSSSITTMVSDAGVPKITEWADQTSHHNNAVGLTGFLGRNPSVKSGAINSLNAVHFDQQPTAVSGNMLNITDNADTSLQWGTGDFFLAVIGDFDNTIVKNATNTNLEVGNFYSKEPFLSGGSLGTPPPAVYTGVVFFGNLPGTVPSTGLFYGTANTAGDSITTATAYNSGAAHLFVIRRRGAKIDLFVDNANVGSSTTTNPNVSNAGTQVRIGADGDANYARLDGDIGEMLAVKGALSMTDEANLVAYLRTKWATP